MRRTMTTGIAMNASVEITNPSSVASCSGRCENDEIASSENRSIFGHRVLGLARVAAVAAVGDGGLPVADPDGHAAQKPVALAHREECIERAPVQQTEVAGVVLQLDLRQPVEQRVEPPRGRELEARLAFTLLADGIHDVAAGAPVVEHARDQLGRILEVGVEHHDRVAAGMVETGGQRGLMAEVARQLNQAHAGIVRGELAELGLGAVGRAVIDEHELELEPVERAAHARVELLDRGLLVVHRAPPR